MKLDVQKPNLLSIPDAGSEREQQTMNNKQYQIYNNITR